MPDREDDVEATLHFFLAPHGGFELHFVTDALCFGVESLIDATHHIGLDDFAFLANDTGNDNLPFKRCLRIGCLEVFALESADAFCPSLEFWLFDAFLLLHTLLTERIAPSEVKELGTHIPRA